MNPCRDSFELPTDQSAAIRVIGVDEAGYGPKLGPLVIAATEWQIPLAIGVDGLPQAFAGVVSSQRRRDGGTIHIADSKRVHQAGGGIARLERSAAALLELASQRRMTFHTLWEELDGRSRRSASLGPWFRKGDCDLPAGINFATIAPLIETWKQRCDESGCRLVRCAAAIVPAGPFNERLAHCGTKGRLLSEATLRLVRRLWDPQDSQPMRILCDKHGGRDRYADLLAETFPEVFPVAIEEGRRRSRYRLGAAEFQFQVASESYLPVAAASILAKYVRELAMDLFNAYWRGHLPDIKPTRGYPVDAARFLEAIGPMAKMLGIERASFWRNR